MTSLALATSLAFLTNAQVAMISVICGAIAVSTAGVVPLPQVLRVLRTGDTDGVSAAATGFTVVACAGWTLYGVIAHIPWTVVSCAAAFSGWTPLLVLLARRGRWSARGRVGAAALCAGLLALLITRGAEAYGLALVGLGILQCAPQVRVVLTSSALSGVSLTTQLVYFLSASGNLGIGLLASDLPLMAWSATFMASSAVVSWRRIQTDPGLRVGIRARAAGRVAASPNP